MQSLLYALVLVMQLHNGTKAEIILNQRMTLSGCTAAAAFYEGSQVRAVCRESQVLAAVS